MSRSPRLDHILLHPTTSTRDIDAAIAAIRADTSRSHGIVVPPVFAKRAVEALRGAGVRVASVAGHPSGLSKPTVKAIEATSLAKDGVDAVILTPLAANLLAGDVEALRAELLESARGIRAAKPTTTLHIRLDLDVLDLDSARFASTIDAIIRGACDGVVLEAQSFVAIAACLAAWPAGVVLERAIVSPDPAADDAADITALGSAS